MGASIDSQWTRGGEAEGEERPAQVKAAGVDGAADLLDTGWREAGDDVERELQGAAYMTTHSVSASLRVGRFLPPTAPRLSAPSFLSSVRRCIARLLPWAVCGEAEIRSVYGPARARGEERKGTHRPHACTTAWPPRGRP